MKFKKLFFGTAGIPLSTPSKSSAPLRTITGIEQVRKLGLDNMELEFVRSINISEEKAPLVRKTALKQGIILTCHAPYYINLNSREKIKIKQSQKRILDSARIAHQCRALFVTFHPGFNHDNQKLAYHQIKKSLQEIVDKLKEENNSIILRPETTGKESQFGSYQELLQLSQELGFLPCFDFSHIFARSLGKINSYDNFRKVLEETEKILGKKCLKNMHIHMSGIAYSQKGELYHLPLQHPDSKFNYLVLLKVWKEFDIKGVVISESPNIEEDALSLQKTYSQLD